MARLTRLFRKFSSALYVTGDKAQHNFVVLTPYVDFDERIQHKSALVESIEARKLHIDLSKIEKRWAFFKMIEGHKTVLEVTKNEIYRVINKLKQEDSEKNRQDIEKLLLHVKLVKDDLKNVKEYSYGIEQEANLAVLALPNFLHPKTPTSREIIIDEFLEKPQIIHQNHIYIGRLHNLLEYKDPTFYFLKSQASLFELAVTNYLQSELVNLGLTQLSNADFARSVVIEGCGTDYLDKTKIFTLRSVNNNDLNRLHLVGGGSLYSFMAYFAKHSVQQSLLPLKYFSIGRKYRPVTDGNDFFNLSQNTVVQIFAATEDDSEKMDATFDILKNQLIALYAPLGYHVRFVYVPAVDLEKGESLKMSLQMFSNFSQKYIDVGYISAYDDYLSKRLLFTYNVGKETKFLRVIAGEVLNVQKLLASVLENNFVDRKPLMTELLEKYI